MPKSSTYTRSHEVAHELDVVLDEQDRDAALLVHAEQRLLELGGLGAVETRRRLVEQHEPRLRHQRPADLDQPADAEAQRLDDAVGDRVEAEQIERLLRALLLLGGRAAPVEQVLPERALAAADPVGDEEVLARRHADEQLDALERARDPEPRPLVRRHAREVVAVEGDRAAVGPEQPEQAVEERGLARAVGPDEPDELARADLEAHVVERGDAGEVSW